jgi:hypothetical protein
MSRWLAEGRVLGKSLRRYHGIVVAGSDPDATAEVALGIAEVQANERKVILGDLMSNAARFGALVADEDPHGIVEAFDFGISVGRVARPVAGNSNLHFIPTGNTAPDYGELLAHPRWSRCCLLRTPRTEPTLLEKGLFQYRPHFGVAGTPLPPARLRATEPHL